MLTVTDTDFALLGERGVCEAFAALVYAVGVGNSHLMRRGNYPRLSDSQIVFRPEPWAGKREEIASCRRVYLRGWGDCDDLVAYRIGECLLAGEQASARVYVKFHVLNGRGRPIRELTYREFLVLRDKLRAGMVKLPVGAKVSVLYHVQLRRASGAIEDPARERGM